MPQRVKASIDPQYADTYGHFGEYDRSRFIRETSRDFIKNDMIDDFIETMIIIGLTPDVVDALKRVYLNRLLNVERTKTIYKGVFYSFTSIIMISTIITSILISIQGIPDVNQHPSADSIWWITWSFSFAVSALSAINKAFHIDKNYFNNKSTHDSLTEEGWEFLGLTGRYEKYNDDEMGHYKAISPFLSRVNCIVRKGKSTELSLGKASAAQISKLASRSTNNSNGNGDSSSPYRYTYTPSARRKSMGTQLEHNDEITLDDMRNKLGGEEDELSTDEIDTPPVSFEEEGKETPDRISSYKSIPIKYEDESEEISEAE